MKQEEPICDKHFCNNQNLNKQTYYLKNYLLNNAVTTINPRVWRLINTIKPNAKHAILGIPEVD